MSLSSVCCWYQDSLRLSVDQHPRTHLPECFVTAVKQPGSEHLLTGVSVPDNVHHPSALSVAVLTSHCFVSSSFWESFSLWFAVDDSPEGSCGTRMAEVKVAFPQCCIASHLHQNLLLAFCTRSHGLWRHGHIAFLTQGPHSLFGWFETWKHQIFSTSAPNGHASISCYDNLKGLKKIQCKQSVEWGKKSKGVAKQAKTTCLEP